MGFFWNLLLCLHLLYLVSNSEDTAVLTDAQQVQHQQQERNIDVAALISFKQSSITADPDDFLRDWSATSTTPCSWKGITCSLNGQVIALNLSGAGLVGSLHLSHLLALPFLLHLNLQGNSFSEIDEDISSLNSTTGPCSLQTLDLSSNNLSNPLNRSSLLLLSSCNNLSSLNLSHNSIPGIVFNFGPSFLRLDLSYNLVSDSTILTHTLSDCQNLNLLNLSHNKIRGDLWVTPLSSCKNLFILDLSYNLLYGEIPAYLVANFLLSLNYLDLSHNNFSGNFSSLEFRDCSKLKFLNLSYNALSGADFPRNLRNCELLETLDLSHNDLQHKLPGVLLGNLKNLRRLSLAYNQFSGEIPPGLGQTCGTLEELDLSANKLSGGLPLTFTSCSSLQILKLGHNMLSGNFLDRVISTLPSLRHLFLPFNNITGSVPLSLTNCSQLRVLDLSSNAFTGNIPRMFCTSPLSTASSSLLENILLPNNSLSDTVPQELANCKNLRTIDLSLNRLTGSLPSKIWTLPNLSNLRMWGNSITGEIPEGICTNGGNLETLILNNNLISGSIPLSLGNCTNLRLLFLSSNLLTGEIPFSIGNLINLQIIQLNDNMLSGQIPPELGKCQSLAWLDLSSNNLSGSIPFELAELPHFTTPTLLSKEHLLVVQSWGVTACEAAGVFETEGIRPEALSNLPIFRSCQSMRIYFNPNTYSIALKHNGSIGYIDLSYNSLSGTIPENFGSLICLQSLNLGHNRLTGNIPDSFGYLKEILFLDLSHNLLQGSIPMSLETLSFLASFDVSNNNFTGPIPSGGQLITFAPSNYENNSGLCGPPLPPCDSRSSSSSCHFPFEVMCVESTHQEDDNDGSETSGLFDWKTVMMGYGCGVLMGIVVGNCIIWKKEEWVVRAFRFESMKVKR
ncbi:receptor-like protein kinase BRI1-like 3 [Malania oleifera]|uniref:receptor-like protein kinase BRI1-like 3 n=1 Tax=Malania oleifera TaxID=397392 RepID=UPI0025ADD661|nr:receptor-like protein kinase BRI1-like 3 [Malania oleifera]